jgi:hypothetical protein
LDQLNSINPSLVFCNDSKTSSIWCHLSWFNVHSKHWNGRSGYQRGHFHKWW